MLRIVSISLAGIRATGVDIVSMTHGALGETRWMNIAFARFLLLGPPHSIVGDQFRQAQCGGKSAPSSELAQILWALTLCQSDLEWTMVRPLRLTNEAATHSFRIAEGKLPAGGTLISRADVAGFMIGEVENPKYSRQIVGLAN